MNISDMIKNLGKMQAGKWATRSALRNPILALAAGGLWVGYKLWQKHLAAGTTQLESQATRKVG